MPTHATHSAHIIVDDTNLYLWGYKTNRIKTVCYQLNLYLRIKLWAKEIIDLAVNLLVREMLFVNRKIYFTIFLGIDVDSYGAYVGHISFIAILVPEMVGKMYCFKMFS